jgi:branched-chain amino acid transport system ATP-binding protein
MLFEARSIVGGYRAIRIVRNVSLQIDAGETLAVLGRNGAGKTTFLRTLIGLADRFEGDVEVAGRRIAPRDPGALARAGVTFVPDDRGVFPRLTIGENIRLARSAAYASTDFDVFALFPDLERRIEQPAGTLSGGQQQQLALGRALSTGPRLLIVDELTQGLQPSIVQSLAEALRTVTREKGLALILVDQNPELAMRVCERVMVMERGQVVADGSSAALTSDPSFLELLVV